MVNYSNETLSLQVVKITMVAATLIIYLFALHARNPTAEQLAGKELHVNSIPSTKQLDLAHSSVQFVPIIIAKLIQ